MNKVTPYALRAALPSRSTESAADANVKASMLLPHVCSATRAVTRRARALLENHGFPNVDQWSALERDVGALLAAIAAMERIGALSGASIMQATEAGLEALSLEPGQ